MAKIPSRIFVYIGTALVVALVLVLWWTMEAGPEQGAKSVGTPTIGGAFTLVDHTGKTVTDGDYAGKFKLVFFGYTYCPDVCPTALSVMTDALDLLGSDAAKVQPLFISVDPARDTPEQLAMYVGHFGKGLVGLTGTAEQVAAAAKAYRVYYRKVDDKDAAQDEYLVDHTAIAYLMAPDGGFKVHFSQNTDAESMARRIREFL